MQQVTVPNIAQLSAVAQRWPKFRADSVQGSKPRKNTSSPTGLEQHRQAA